MRLIIIFIYVFLQTPVLFSKTVKFIDEGISTELLFNARYNDGSSIGSFYQMVVDLGTGVDEANAPKLYIPLNVQASPSTTNPYNYYVAKNSPSDVITAKIIPLLKTDGNIGGDIQLQFTLTNSDAAESYLYAAVKENLSGTFYSLKPTTSVKLSGGASNTDYSGITFSLNSICLIYSNSTTNCNVYGKDTFTVYFFMTPDLIDDNTSVDLSNYKDGRYLQVLISSEPNTSVPKLTSFSKGDERIKLTIDTVTLKDSYKTLSISFNDLTLPGNYDPPFSSSRITSYLEFDYIQDGSFYVRPLVNGTSYNFSIGQMDKYGFVSPLTASTGEISPIGIQAFLDKNACYLISAGFQKDHFVLDYFRNFRDRFLMSNEFGRRLVSFYYLTAPAYAKRIWSNSLLAAFIRIIAYGLYIFMHLLPLLALFTAYKLLNLKRGKRLK